MKSGLLAIALLPLLSGCVSVGDLYNDGKVTETTSEVDGVKQVTMHESWLRDNKLKLGAIRTSKMPDGACVLVVEIPAAVNLAEEITISVDGLVKTFKYSDRFTNVNHGSRSSQNPYDRGLQSSRRFEIDRALLAKILESKKTVFKLTMLNGEYIEDILTTPATNANRDVRPAKTALQDFYAKAFN